MVQRFVRAAEEESGVFETAAVRNARTDGNGNRAVGCVCQLMVYLVDFVDDQIVLLLAGVSHQHYKLVAAYAARETP